MTPDWKWVWLLLKGPGPCTPDCGLCHHQQRLDSEENKSIVRYTFRRMQAEVRGERFP